MLKGRCLWIPAFCVPDLWQEVVLSIYQYENPSLLRVLQGNQYRESALLRRHPRAQDPKENLLA